MMGNNHAELAPKETLPRPGEIMGRLIGSITADNPVRLSKPKISFKDFNLSEQQKRDLEAMRNIATPQEVIEAIFKHPPAVIVDKAKIYEKEGALVDYYRKQGMPDNKIIELVFPQGTVDQLDEITYIKPDKSIRVFKPTKRDLEIAKIETELPPDIDPVTREYMEMFINNAKQFMMTPRVRDGFGPNKEDHQNRRLWEEGVMDVFYLVSDEWGQAFKDAVDKNRYSKNRRMTLVSFPSYFDTLTLPDRIGRKIKYINERFSYAQKLAENGKPDAASNIISAECASLIRFFSKKNPRNYSPIPRNMS
jgi:hypothetical protein